MKFLIHVFMYFVVLIFFATAFGAAYLLFIDSAWASVIVHTGSIIIVVLLVCTTIAYAVRKILVSI